MLIQFALMIVQRAESGDLKYPRLLNEHGDRVALLKPWFAVRGCGDGKGWLGNAVQSQAGNYVSNNRGRWPVRAAESSKPASLLREGKL